MKSTILISILLAGVAFADDKTPVVNKKRANQEKRIAEGVANGSLTGKEATKLQRQENEARRNLRQDKRDGGGLTLLERTEARQKSRELSKKIYNQKHDAQTAPPKP